MEFWSDRIPSLSVLIYALLSMVIPWVVYAVNRWLHRMADPPWKKEPEHREEKP